MCSPSCGPGSDGVRMPSQMVAAPGLLVATQQQPGVMLSQHSQEGAPAGAGLFERGGAKF
jgi:hypothetical protein